MLHSCHASLPASRDTQIKNANNELDLHSLNNAFRVQIFYEILAFE